MKLFGPFGFYRDALKIALPVMLQQLLMSLVSLVDNFMVAGLGDVKMGAINVVNQIGFVYMIMLFTVCGAGGIWLAQYRGAKDAAGMQQAWRFKVVASLVLTVVVFAVCQLFPAQILGLMSAGNSAADAIQEQGVKYLRILSFSWFAFALSTAAGTSLREIGKTSIPLYISIIATAVNTIGNYILIYGNLGAPRLEVQGAAIATVLARCVELILFLLYLKCRPQEFYVSLRRIFPLDIRLSVEILKRSGMMIVSETTWVLSETIMIALYNGRGGPEVVAGMAAGFTMANILFLIFNGIHVASAVIVGGSLGAGKLDEARQKARWLESASLIAGALVGALGVSLLLLIPVVFANLSPEARRMSSGLLIVVALYMPIWAYLNALFAISRAGGDTQLGMWVDVSVNLIFFLPAAFLLARFTSISALRLFAVVKLTDFLKLIIAVWWIRKERWVRNLAAPPL